MRMSDPELPLIDFLEFSMFAQSLSVTERPLSDLQHCAWNSAKMSHMNFQGKVFFILFWQYFTFWDFFSEISDPLRLPFFYLNSNEVRGNLGTKVTISDRTKPLLGTQKLMHNNVLQTISNFRLSLAKNVSNYLEYLGKKS